MSENRCVCCGEIIPEGMQVCFNCVNASQKTERCWLYDYNCPCRSGTCYGLPDEGCPVYRWFKKLILKDGGKNA